MGSYSLISADSHINEPPDTFVERVPASLRDRAPHVEHIDDGDVWIFETGAPRAIGLDSMAGMKFQDYKRSGHSYEAMRAGAYDPRARVEDMDQDGVDAEVIYPGTGFRLASMEDPELRLACMRAYNDWLSEFCAEAPGRFVGLGLVPVQDVDAAAAEIERIAGLGLRGVVLPALPALQYSDAFYEPLWAAAEDNSTFGAFVRLALLTAQRRQKLAEMRWQDVTIDGAWDIPTEDREKGNGGALVLPEVALDIIRARPRLNPYVFAGRDGPFTSFSPGKRALDAKVAKSLGEPLPPWTIHDLRRTSRSLMARAGVPRDVAERVMGHTLKGVEGIYDRHSYREEKAAALAKLARLIALILDPPGENVVALREAAAT